MELSYNDTDDVKVPLNNMPFGLHPTNSKTGEYRGVHLFLMFTLIKIHVTLHPYNSKTENWGVQWCSIFLSCFSVLHIVCGYSREQSRQSMLEQK